MFVSRVCICLFVCVSWHCLCVLSTCACVPWLCLSCVCLCLCISCACLFGPCGFVCDSPVYLICVSCLCLIVFSFSYVCLRLFCLFVSLAFISFVFSLCSMCLFESPVFACVPCLCLCIMHLSALFLTTFVFISCLYVSLRLSTSRAFVSIVSFSISLYRHVFCVCLCPLFVPVTVSVCPRQ